MFDFLKKKKVNSNTVSAVIVAAGNGSRMGLSIKKQFIEICDIPVIIHTLRAFEQCNIIDEIILVTAEEDIPKMYCMTKEFGITKLSKIVAGGNTRASSVKNGLSHVTTNYVAIHDGARPCILPSDITRVVNVAVNYGAAVLGTKITDTIKSVSVEGLVTATIDREPLWQVQTPQCFMTKIIKEAYGRYSECNITDDCMAVEQLGVNIVIVAGNSLNIKLTNKNDIILAQSILQENSKLGIDK